MNEYEMKLIRRCHELCLFYMMMPFSFNHSRSNYYYRVYVSTDDKGKNYQKYLHIIPTLELAQSYFSSQYISFLFHVSFQVLSILSLLSILLLIIK